MYPLKDAARSAGIPEIDETTKDTLSQEKVAF